MKPEVIVTIIAAVVSSVSVVVSIISVRLVNKQAIEQKALQERLNDQESNFEKKRFIISLWDKMTAISSINPGKPVEVDVRNAVNTLELVSICWQAGIVDKRMVVLSFGNLFNSLYVQIEQIHQRLPGCGRTGHELLSHNPAISAVRNQIREEIERHGNI